MIALLPLLFVGSMSFALAFSFDFFFFDCSVSKNDFDDQTVLNKTTSKPLQHAGPCLQG